ncbi:MAG TPA: diguanylate cyclase [Chloroflexota bacterium]|nr:diguanylate cyclase [Chloroflexota bacterium]
MRELPPGLRRYLALLHVTCAAVLAYQVISALRHGWPTHISAGTIIALVAYAALSYLAEHTTLQIKGDAWQNLSTAAYIGSLLLFVPPIPILIALVAALASQARYGQTALAKRAFNVTHPALSVGLAGLLCSVYVRPTALLHLGFLAALPGLTLLLALFYLLDIGTMLGLLMLLGNGSPWKIWGQAYRHTLLPELAAGTVGILGAIIWTYDPFAVALLVLPLMALRSAFRANAQAEARARMLRQRGSQLETVLAVGQHLRLQQSRADLLQAVTEAARAILGADTVTGYLRDEEDPALLRRIALAPPDAPIPGPMQLAAANSTDGTVDHELRLPLELDGSEVAGLLLIAGVPKATNEEDRGVLAILATQAAIALQNAYLHERALALAARDGLTDLLNRREARTRLEEEVSRAERGGHPLCLLMIDLDGFGAINNTYGHQVGDAALRAVARVLEAGVRALDVPARYGGDEFVVLLPETTMEQGIASADRLVAALTVPMTIEGATTLNLTASIGVAALPDHGRTSEELLRAADQATYAAKHAGKGRVACPEDAALALDRDPMVLAAQLAHANMATVAALAAAVDAKDPYTRGHSHRVSRYATTLARIMALPAPDVARIELAGQLHDVGKIGVPDAILTKPGKLGADEYLAIQQHPVIGERMLADVPFLREILPAVRHHHQRWDGEGYPDRLYGAQIPPDAAILAVADSFDAMTSSRTYRAALPAAEARRRILEGSGSQFSPEVVRAFERAVAAGSITASAAPWCDTPREVFEHAS